MCVCVCVCVCAGEVRSFIAKDPAHEQTHVDLHLTV